MADKHTPGPWHLRAPQPSQWPQHTIIDNEGRYVAAVQIQAHNRAAADARLIATAPDLLAERDALIAERDRLRACADVLIDLVKAIDGQVVCIEGPIIEAGDPEVGMQRWPWADEWLSHARAALSSTGRGE